jgi:HK97 gp10 family phage protein
MVPRLTFQGGKELAAALAQLPDRASKRVQRDALLAGAEPVIARAEALAPRAPGEPDMADHIVASTATGPHGEPAVAVGPSRAFFYGIYQEEGTSRHGAQPFLRPALDGESGAAIRATVPVLAAAIIRKAPGGLRLGDYVGGGGSTGGGFTGGPIIAGPGGGGIL